MNKPEKIERVRTFLKKKECLEALDYMDTLSVNEQFGWINSVCEALKNSALQADQIWLLKSYFEHRLSLITEYDVDSDLDWFVSREMSSEFGPELEQTINSLKPIIGDHSEWDTFVDKVKGERRSLPGIVGQVENKRIDKKHIEFWNKKIDFTNALEEICPYWKVLCQLISYDKALQSSDHKSPSHPVKSSPLEIARKFQFQSKVKTYSIESISFAMKKAKENPSEIYYKELVRIIQNSTDCPDEIADETIYNTIKRWIKFYDQNAGIARKDSK